MKRILPLLLALAMPAHAANWLLAADGNGQNLANDGALATISDADLPNNTLRVTVENAADHTLMLGRHTTNYGNDNTTARSDRNADYSGPVDLTKPIYAAGDDTPWTIVSVANMAFYNNKALLTAPDGILDLTTVTNIGIGAFGNVTAMPGFRLSHNLERVGASAFMSTFGTSSYDPQLPASLKVVETGAFSHNDQYDTGVAMSLAGEIELRGVEVIQSGAFHWSVGITAITVGPRLVELGRQGVNVRQKSVAQGPFEACFGLRSVTWLGPAPTNTIQKRTFYCGQASTLTNWVYEAYLDGWIAAFEAAGMTVNRSLADPSARIVGKIVSGINGDKNSVWLGLLEGQPPVEGAPVFDEAPVVAQSGGAFTFRGNLSAGEGVALYAVFRRADGAAYTNAIATGVSGDPSVYHTITVPASLPANRTYSFGILGVNARGTTFREGHGTFFNGAVSVAAPAAFSENGGTGSFTFSRTGTDGELVVPFSVSGTAEEFLNYRELPRSVTIPDGASSATVDVEALVDLPTETATTLVLSTARNGLFLVAGSAASATATISQWTPPAPSGFARQLTYTVAGYEGGDEAWFPVLVRVPAGKVANAAQMAFFDESGAPLHFEVDTWDADGESLVWVGLRTLRPGAKILLAAGRKGYASPDLSAGLWRRAGYPLVLHCGDEGPALASSAPQPVAAAARAENGGEAGSDHRFAAGAAGAARTISAGANNADWAAIRVANFERYLADPTRFTVSLWLNHRADATVGEERLFGNRLQDNSEIAGFTARIDKNYATNAPAFIVSGNSALGAAGFPNYLSVVPSAAGAADSFLGGWAHASFSFQPRPQGTRFHVAGGRARCRTWIQNGWRGGYVDEIGNFLAIESIGPEAPVFFGHGSDKSTANSFKGALDEIRVRDGMVSDDWAFAEYATVADPGFLSGPVSGDPTAIFLLD